MVLKGKVCQFPFKEVRTMASDRKKAKKISLVRKITHCTAPRSCSIEAEIREEKGTPEVIHPGNTEKSSSKVENRQEAGKQLEHYQQSGRESDSEPRSDDSVKIPRAEEPIPPSGSDFDARRTDSEYINWIQHSPRTVRFNMII